MYNIPEDLKEDWTTAHQALLCNPSNHRRLELKRVIELVERIGKLENFRDEAEAIFDGELRTDWADFFQTAWNLLQETKEYK